MRNFIVLPVTVTLVFAVSACTAVHPIRISVEGEALIMTFCEAMTLEDLEVLQAIERPTSELDWRSIAVARGPLEVSRGEQITIDEADLLRVGESAFRADVESRLSVEFEREGYGPENPAFRITERGLREGQWLRSDGTVVPRPCD